jgi:hypothetical protein
VVELHATALYGHTRSFTELSAFLSLEWSLSTALFGGVSSRIALLPRSVPRCTTLLF